MTDRPHDPTPRVDEHRLLIGVIDRRRSDRSIDLVDLPGRSTTRRGDVGRSTTIARESNRARIDSRAIASRARSRSFVRSRASRSLDRAIDRSIDRSRPHASLFGTQSSRSIVRTRRHDTTRCDARRDDAIEIERVDTSAKRLIAFARPRPGDDVVVDVDVDANDVDGRARR